nr:hypothetical protein [uncultured Pseudomonas sp.]
MSHYQFNPEKSFLANLYWNDTDVLGVGLDRGKLPRIGVIGDSSSPWATEGWLHAGADDFTHWSAEFTLSKRKFETQFWFGCYETDGQYDYEIRAAAVDTFSHQWKYASHRLEVSRNGYLGVYPTSEEPGHDAFANGSMLWRFDDLPGERLKPGSAYGLYPWISLHGKRVKRLIEDGFPYLSEDQGEEGWIGLEMLKVGVARP